MHQHSLADLAKALQKKTFSAVELTHYFLKRIETHHPLNAFIHVDPEGALAAAKKADSRIQAGTATSLTGIPLAHKDNFCTTTMPTTCGSKMLAHFQAPYQATVVEKLAEQGTILLGKTNMDEFAMGSSNENSFFGPVKNPWNPALVPGGSSGGSAAAVSAELVPFATGTDTGGSVRQPAAFCGVTGLKPTYGLISRFGMVAYASSLDQAGILARYALDLALVLECLAGFDAKDSTSVPRPVPAYAKTILSPPKKLRIGLPTTFFQEEVDPNIQDALYTAIDCFKRAGYQIKAVELKLTKLWVPCYYVIACAEASSNLARYDGIRFGYRSPQGETLQTLIQHTRSEGFGEEVKRRILTGTHILSAGYFDAYYLQAQKIRRLIQNEFLDLFKSVDLIIGPTTPTLPFKIGQKNSNPTQAFLADTFTVAANLAGFPALSVPAGFSGGLPIGMQLMGPHFSEELLLQMAHFYQQCSNWHTIRPNDIPSEGEP